VEGNRFRHGSGGQPDLRGSRRQESVRPGHEQQRRRGWETRDPWRRPPLPSRSITSTPGWPSMTANQGFPKANASFAPADGTGSRTYSRTSRQGPTIRFPSGLMESLGGPIAISPARRPSNVVSERLPCGIRRGEPCREPRQAPASGLLPAGLGSYCVKPSARP